MAKTFSIITVCFNSEKTIRRTFESLLKQTNQDFEYIVIDGKSEDNTLSIIKEYEEKFHGKMRYISEPDTGIYDAMNKGIKMATGKVIGIINSDDYYENNALETVKNFIPDNNEFVIYGMERYVKKGQEEKIVLYHHTNLDCQMITHPTCFISKDVYDHYGRYNTNFKSSADYEFMLRLYHNTSVKFIPIYNIISNFEVGGMSSSEIGFRETAKLKLHYKIISRKKYIFTIVKSVIHELFVG